MIKQILSLRLFTLFTFSLFAMPPKNSSTIKKESKIPSPFPVKRAVESLLDGNRITTTHDVSKWETHVALAQKLARKGVPENSLAKHPEEKDLYLEQQLEKILKGEHDQ